MHLFLMDWIRVIMLLWRDNVNEMDIGDFPILWVMILTILMLCLWDVVMV